MDPVKIIEVLKGASPWLVLAASLLTALWMLLSYWKKKQERSDIHELRDITVSVHDDCEEMAEMLAAHVATTEQSVGAFNSAVEVQTQLLTKIASELSSMNAVVSGRELTTETAKFFIQTQWNTCREETVRLLLNSIRNNHFIGNEKMVARKVARAWKQASEKASSVVGATPGMTYPFVPLFDLHIRQAWERAWDWSLPIYYGDTTNREEALEDLAARIRSLFDEISRSYFNLIEDIDRGTLYGQSEHTSSIRAASEALIPVNDNKDETADTMLSSLEKYQAGESSGGYKPVREAVAEEYEKKRPLHESPPPVSRGASQSISSHHHRRQSDG